MKEEKRNYKLYVHISPSGKRYYGITMQEVEKRWKNGVSSWRASGFIPRTPAN